MYLLPDGNKDGIVKQAATPNAEVALAYSPLARIALGDFQLSDALNDLPIRPESI